jgi:hypothetical protein
MSGKEVWKSIQLSGYAKRKIAQTLGVDPRTANVEASISGNFYKAGIEVVVRGGGETRRINLFTLNDQEHFSQGQVVSVPFHHQTLEVQSTLSYDDCHPWTERNTVSNLAVEGVSIETIASLDFGHWDKDEKNQCSLKINGHKIALSEEAKASFEKRFDRDPPTWVIDTSLVAAIALKAAGEDFESITRPRYAVKARIPNREAA